MIYQNIMMRDGCCLDQSQRYRITIGALLLGILLATAGCAGQYVMGVLGGGTLAYHVLERERFIDETTDPIMSLPVDASSKSSFKVGSLSLELPVGALEHTTTVTVKKDELAPVPELAGLRIISDAYRILPTGLVFDPPASVTVSYDERKLPGDVDEIQLHVYQYDIQKEVYAQLVRAAGSSIADDVVSADVYGSGWVILMTSVYPTVLSGTALSRSSVKLVFDLDLGQESAATLLNYSIVKGDVDGESELIGPPIQATQSTNDREVTLTMPEDLESDTSYTILLSNVESIRGYEVDSDTSQIEVMGDWDAPGQITGLAVSAGPGSGEVVLAWVAPFENGTEGLSAESYQVRYATAAIDSSSWESALTADGAGVPRSPGSTETMIVSGLSSGMTYYFGVRAVDEVGNVSVVSNSPSAVPLP